MFQLWHKSRGRASLWLHFECLVAITISPCVLSRHFVQCIMSPWASSHTSRSHSYKRRIACERHDFSATCWMTMVTRHVYMITLCSTADTICVEFELCPKYNSNFELATQILSKWWKPNSKIELSCLHRRAALTQKLSSVVCVAVTRWLKEANLSLSQHLLH